MILLTNEQCKAFTILEVEKLIKDNIIKGDPGEIMGFLNFDIQMVFREVSKAEVEAKAKMILAKYGQ